jgi:hypothetical protein
MASVHYLKQLFYKRFNLNQYECSLNELKLDLPTFKSICLDWHRWLHNEQEGLEIEINVDETENIVSELNKPSAFYQDPNLQVISTKSTGRSYVSKLYKKLNYLKNISSESNASLNNALLEESNEEEIFLKPAMASHSSVSLSCSENLIELDDDEWTSNAEQNRLSELDSENRYIKDSLIELQKQLSVAEEANTQMENDMESLNSKLTNQIRSNSELKIKLNVLTEENEISQKELVELRGNNQIILDENKNLSKKLKEEVDSRELMITQLSAQINNYTLLLTKLETDLLNQKVFL